MDLVGYRQDVFEKIRGEYGAFMAEVGLQPKDYIPVSGQEGDNITYPSMHMPWYAGKTVLKSLDEFEKLSQMFKVLADPSRLRILFALERLEMCVCDLAALLEITESAVSHQLRFLRNVNLVKNRREGTVLYYRLVDDHVKILTDVGLSHIRERKNV